MIEEILPAIIAAFSIVSLIAIGIFVSDIPKMEREYRKKLERENNTDWNKYDDG